MRTAAPTFVSTLVAMTGISFLTQATAADRSTYSVGDIQFRQSIPTSISRDIFVYTEDVNRDGYTDLLLTVYSPTNAPALGGRSGAILLNNGDNTFTEAAGDKPSTEWAREILVADFNSDNFQDIFIADHGWDTAPFPGFRNQLLLGGANGYVDATDRLPALNDFSHNAAVGDIDKDGDIDIVVTNNPLGVMDERPYLLLNDGTAHFTLNRDRLPPSFVSTGNNAQWNWAVDLADLDGDGWTDLILGRRAGAASLPTRVHWNQGDGTFSDTLMTNLPDMANFVPQGDYEVIELYTTDLDNDGDRDLLVGAYDTSYRGVGIQMLRNDGNRVFTDSTTSCLSGITQTRDASREPPYFFRSMDVNLDGTPDITASGSNDNNDTTILAFENSSGGKLRAITLGTLSTNNETRTRLIAHPLKANGEFGFGEVFVWEPSPGNKQIGINYVPLSSVAQPVAGVRFDECSNQITARVDAGQLGKFELKFKLLQTSPTVLIQALAENAVSIGSLPTDPATFDAATGKLLIPQLRVDDATPFSNLEFTLIDGAQLIFQLTGSN